MTMGAGGVSKQKVATVIVAADGSGDTTDIQEGHDLLPADGGSVWIKEGTYTISSAISITKSNIGLIGSGRGTIINNVGEEGLSIGDISNVIIENLSFTGTSVGATILAAVGTPKEVIIKYCYFYNSPAIALDFRTGRFAVTGNYFYNIGDEATLRNAVTLNSPQSIIINNIFIDCPFVALSLAAASINSIVSNNIVSNSGNAGIQIASVDTIVTENVCIGNTTHGIFITEADRCIVSGNICRNNVRNGILVSASDDVIVEGNVCTGNDSANSATYDGIQIYLNCDNCMVSSNRCSENDGFEINIRDNTCDKTLVHGNHCIGTDHEGTINDAGTDTVSADNVEA